MKATGTLRLVVAIGGETTGVIVETPKNEYELDFRNEKKLARKLPSVDGKVVVVEGTLETIQGTEKERKIIVATSLEAK